MKMSVEIKKVLLIIALVNLLAFSVIAGLMVIGQTTFMQPSVGKIITAGGSGTWFTFGFIMFIITLIIAPTVLAVIYGNFESRFGKVRKALALSHVVMFTFGMLLATSMFMYGGYKAAAVNMAGHPELQHPTLVVFNEPITYSIIVATLGTVIGSIAMLSIVVGKKKKDKAAMLPVIA